MERIVIKPLIVFRWSACTHPAARNARFRASGFPRKIKLVKSDGLYDTGVIVRYGRVLTELANSRPASGSDVTGGIGGVDTSGAATGASSFNSSSVPAGSHISGSANRSIRAAATFTYKYAIGSNSANPAMRLFAR